MSNDTQSWDDVFDAPRQKELPADTVAEVKHRPGRRKKRKKAKSAKRLDIQGLRMVAVVAVVVNHLTDHPVGGFTGVDVFFVISGFLMTGILAREVDRTGKNPLRYLGQFYARRARRLLPASLLVILLTLVGANAVFTSTRFHTTAVDGGWAAVFLANWHEIATGTDYFAAGLPPSPLQHYWSLSVEEQFYFAWPLLLLLVSVGLAARRRYAALALSAVAVVASAIFATTFHNTVIAYFSTWTRVWELALGGVVFGLAPYIRLRSRPLSILSCAGLVVIVVSFFVVHPGAGFPFPGAVLPCVGSAMVLAAASPGSRVWNPVLTNPVSVFVGDISYSVYLVHFPLIVILSAYMPHAGAYYYLAVVAGTVGSAVLMYAFVELPVLQSNILRPKSERSVLREYPIPRGATASVAAAAVLLGVISLSVWPGAQADSQARLAQIQQAIQQTTTTGNTPNGVELPPVGPQTAALQNGLKSALLAGSWPDLTPPLDKPVLGISQKAGCGNTTFDASACIWGDPNASHTIFLVGDSRSAFYSDGFIKLVRSIPGWQVRAGGGSDCAFADPPVSENDNAKSTQCPVRNQTLVDEIKQVRPDLLVVTSGSSDETVNPKVATEIKKVQAYVKKIVFLEPPPPTIDPNTCYTKGSAPADCVASLPDYWKTTVRFAQNQLVPDFPGSVLIDPTNWFSYQGQCPMFVGNVPMKHDQLHITPQYAEFLEPVILETFQELKLLPASTT